MILELKALAATCLALVLGGAATALNGLNAHSALLGSVPSWAQGLILTCAPPLAVGLAAYKAKHTPRPDLEKNAEAVFDRHRLQLADWLAARDPKLAPQIDALLGVTPPVSTSAVKVAATALSENVQARVAAAAPAPIAPPPPAVLEDPALADDYEPDLADDPALADDFQPDATPTVPPPAG